MQQEDPAGSPAEVSGDLEELVEKLMNAMDLTSCTKRFANNLKGFRTSHPMAPTHRHQNCDPAAGSVATASKGAEPSRGAARGPVGKRLQQELMTLMMYGDKGISAFPELDNLFKWMGTIHGAADTAYEDLKYKLSLEFPSGYPYNAPPVKFLTPCYHPNVDTQGNICLDILKDK
ncbi:hypothetical protein R6Z07M_012998 [Ovis aries]